MLQRDFAAGMSEPITVVVDGDLGDATVQDGLKDFIAAVDEDGRFTLAGVQTSADGSLAVVQLVQDAEAMSEKARADVLALRDDARARRRSPALPARSTWAARRPTSVDSVAPHRLLHADRHRRRAAA